MPESLKSNFDFEIFISKWPSLRNDFKNFELSFEKKIFLLKRVEILGKMRRKGMDFTDFCYTVRVRF